jgi:uncharacterized protein (DUF58 family)
MSIDPRKYLDPATIARLQGLELRARCIIEGYMSGVHRSPWQGYSVEFAEHREYAPGDDLRHVDWKVYGRTDKVYLKQYEEETNLIVYLLLDVSHSMHYQGEHAPLSKLQYAQCVAAALAWIVLRQQDSVALATFDCQVRSLVRPASHPAHWQHLLHVMEHAEGARKTAVGPILHELAQRCTKRGLVVVLSDMLDDVESVVSGLKHFRHRRHDALVMHVLDADELEFPFRQPTLFEGLEEAAPIWTDAAAIRRAYLREMRHYLVDLQRGCRENQVDYVQLRTDLPLDVSLSAYLTSRRTRV